MDADDDFIATYEGSLEYRQLRSTSDDLKTKDGSISCSAAGLLISMALDLVAEKAQDLRAAWARADEWESKAKSIAAESGLYDNPDMLSP